MCSGEKSVFSMCFLKKYFVQDYITTQVTVRKKRMKIDQCSCS